MLFADVVHSMDIAAAVGPERLREIMAELVARAAVAVQRYGGTVDKFTGDGIMAVFGAPIALEDHAVRACLAALGIHEEASRLARDVQRRDAVELQLRVGLNSGQVVAGDIGTASFGYTAVGAQVGMAQRMESVAPPGAVMLSESTGRLVGDVAVLGEPEMVWIKGSDAPVGARRLLRIEGRRQLGGHAESPLVGRRWELSALEGLLARAVGGHGAVAGVVGPPGIGKSRLAREVASMAARRGIEVFTAFCESHTTQVPFHAVTRLLRAVTGIDGVDGQAARERLQRRFDGADPEDLLLLDDLLGVRDPASGSPSIDPDARRRRLTSLVNAASLARTQPALFVIEDAHWVDEVSESMLADFLAVIRQTRSLVVITSRPEYQGALMRMADARTITLAPLRASETKALIGEMLGPDPGTEPLGRTIAERAAGNPFFAEEIVRELAERGALRGRRGAYASTSDGTQVSVPATLQATIAARIDRLSPEAKRTLSAAAVIGSRFDPDLLSVLGVKPVVADLLATQLIDQVRFTRQPEYVFHHPLVRAVAYESQLKSDRAEVHRRLALAIERRDPGSVEENAALIAEHLEAADDVHAAYEWHMRAATWATNRDIAAARLSWQRAEVIADALPLDDPHRAVLRIPPRTMLCGTAWRVHANVVGPRFEELRHLCAAAGDEASLAIAMAGLAADHAFGNRVREASQLASEAMDLLESVGDPTLTVGLARPAIYAKLVGGEWSDVLRWSQRVIDLADGDPAKGNFIVGCPLAAALTTRALVRSFLGRPGWRDDLRDALDMARSTDSMSYASVVGTIYWPGISHGILAADDDAVCTIEDALRVAERSGDDLALAVARMTLGIALVHRRTTADHDRGHLLLTEVSQVFRRERYALAELPLVTTYMARQTARSGNHDDAILLMRSAADSLVDDGVLRGWGVAASGVLVETLLEHGADGDVADAAAEIDRQAAATGDGLVVRDVWLLRLHAKLALARRDDDAYRVYRDRYRAMANSLDFQGHVAWAEAMP